MFKKLTPIAVSLLALTILVVAPVLAAPNAQSASCGQDYTVQADDWLSRLAEKFYGDLLAYPAIVNATNAAAQADASYAAIANPDLIEIGWKLCLPADVNGVMMMSDGMMDGAMEKDGAMMDDSMSQDGTMMDGAMEKDGAMMDDGTMDDTMAGDSMGHDGTMMDDSQNKDGQMMDDSQNMDGEMMEGDHTQ